MALRPFTPSWLAGEPTATALLPRHFGDATARQRAVEAAARRRADPRLLEALEVRHAAQERQRDALGRPGTVCVVTGQQAGLFGGPLYTIYKAAAAVVNARTLQEETGTACVPVFWLQNEDHDFEEIAQCAVLGRDGALHRLGLRGASDGGSVSIGARRLGDAVQEPLTQVGAALEGLPDAAQVMACLQRAYRPDVSPDAAFADLIHAWFGRYGLLVVNPRHPALEEAANPVHARAWVGAAEISDRLLARVQALQQGGIATQVHVRRDSPLSFVHPEGRDGPRYRVERHGASDSLRICGTERVIPEAEAQQGPFSTSALLRPLLQDHWLPTAAYVGGPGEIAYFAQLPPLYEWFDLPMPLIVPRARFRVIDAACERWLDQLGLEAGALTKSRAELLTEVHPSGGDGLLPGLAEGEASLIRQLEAFASIDWDPGVAKAATKTTASVQHAVQKLRERYQRAAAQQDDVLMKRLDRVCAWLQPGGAPQERVHAWPWYGARYGTQAFIDTVMAAVQPFDGELRDLRLESAG